MKRVFNSIISPDNQIIKNHIVQGAAVLPGLAYVDMLLSLASKALKIDPSVYSIKRLSVFNSLVVSKERPLALRVTFERSVAVTGNAYWEIVVEGSPEGTDKSSSDLTHYVSAELHESSDTHNKQIDIAAMKKKASRRVDVESVYARSRRAGLVHSGVMQVDGEAFFVGDECLVEIALKKTQKQSAQSYSYHPALLDGAAMSSALLLSDTDENLFLPTYYASISCSESLGNRCFALLKVSEQKSSHVLDMDIFNDDGRQVANLEGIAVVPMRDRQTVASQQQADAEQPLSDETNGTVAVSHSSETLGYIKEKLLEIFGKYLRRAPASINLISGFFDLGMESAQLLKVLKEMEDVFSIKLNPTILFENSNLRDLMLCLESEYSVSGANAKEAVANTIEAAKRVPRAKREATLIQSRTCTSSQLNIAIVGVSGRYPQAKNIDEFWGNLSEGKNCIGEIPEERWNWREYFSEDRSESGRHYSKWGGFIDDFDKFDPIFFNISPREAELLDPQDRLTLEQAWLTLEDAGYTRERLHRLNQADSPHQVGVYIGSMFQEYPLYAAEASLQGKKVGLDSGLSSISARISYFWDLNGPCMTIDTACSSSLTAIHQACQSLHSGQIDAALAGGVNLTMHPNKYLMLSDAQFISTKGHCASFGDGGDGYIPGEGVGILMLKRLEDAERDNDRIYAVIKGAAINHGGKASGYTVPSPKAQQRVIEKAIKDSLFDPETISYIEAHGTGTSLGDPIEVKGLTNAFNCDDKRQFCWLGSVKSNIGHCEAAAGVAGITKVLLQMKHKKIVPSLHSETLNPHIDFEKTPFSVNQTLRDWERPTVDDIAYPRRAGISSFGAGGANAHIVLEEYTGCSGLDCHADAAMGGSVAILLSAKDEERLARQAGLLLSLIEEKCPHEVSLLDIAYTLQIGREAMENRLAIVVQTVDEIKDKLTQFINGATHIENLYRGQVQFGDSALSSFDVDAELQEVVEKWAQARKYSKLSEFWVKGLNFDWESLYHSDRPGIVSIPSEPFAKERFWVPTEKYAASNTSGNAFALNALYPLLHRNTSDLVSQRYSTRLTGKEFFLSDHIVRGKRVLPAVACLEMVTEAISDSTPDAERDNTVISLHNVVWISPVIVSDDEVELQIDLFPEDDGALSFEIYTGHGEGGDEQTVYCQGLARLNAADATDSIGDTAVQLDALRRRFQHGGISVEECYKRFEASGIAYGPSHKGLDEVYVAGNEVLAKVSLPTVVRDTLEDFILHPGLLDAAVQSSIALVLGEDSADESLALPYMLDELRVVGECQESMWSWIRLTGTYGANNSIRKYDVDIFGADGRLCLAMQGSSTKAIPDALHADESGRKSDELGTLILRPQWNGLPTADVVADEGEAGADSGATLVARQQLILCGFNKHFADVLEKAGCNLPIINIEEDHQNVIAEDIGARYESVASSLFKLIKRMLQDGELNKSRSKTLLQLLVPNDGPEQSFSGLVGLLRTASLENPMFDWRLIRVSGDTPAATVAEHIRSLDRHALGITVQCDGEQCSVLRFGELERIPNAPEYDANAMPWKEGGVYLLSGCAGGLGRIFAKEISTQVKNATLIITGRSELTTGGEGAFDGIERPGVKVNYLAVDVCDRDSLKRLVADIVGDYGEINGIIHAAGILRDNFIIRKPDEEFEQVLQAKVSGLVNLDMATSALTGLDFFVLFSSVSGAIGKVGQADYSAANGFMDSFAKYRSELRGSGQRSGKTLSINWPLWQSDGMTMDEESAKALREEMGMYAMDAASGIHAFYHALSHDDEQLMVIEGDLPKLSAYFGKHGKYLASRVPSATGEVAGGGTRLAAQEGVDERLLKKTENYLKNLLSDVIKLPAQRIKLNEPLEKYGIDSVMVMKLTTELEKSFGTLSKTLFFEYQNLNDVMGYFLSHHRETLLEVMDVSTGALQPQVTVELDDAPLSPRPAVRKRRDSRFSMSVRQGDMANFAESPLDVAIIGIAGKYPQAENLDEYWDNLRNGRDCIEEIPADRWDWRKYFSDDRSLPGKHYSRWGGFISDVDKFDPLFFNISPLEAVRMDPQERLFLEHVWAALEDAGYTREALTDSSVAGQVGVYAGVMFGDYQLFGAEETLRGNSLQVGGSYASIANRVSYFLNLHGPSMTVDTMCSSSLTTLHLACQDLRLGRTNLAIAGGVNVSIHPNKYLGLSAGQFISSNGACESFGEGGDGYVPGEGVGVVLIKRLSDAVRDGDNIYGVIKGTAVNHGGKTNGYSVPNPNAQCDVIQRAVKQSRLDPRAITYIEAHGTGTKLGDPIEITGLSKALSSMGREYGCWIGSAKSNVGHCESAAGVAGLTKVLLQMKHQQLVPSLHSGKLNPNIDFENSPFTVNQQLRSWDATVVDGIPHPRVAGVSSFGAGGSNAHVIIEEYTTPLSDGVSQGEQAGEALFVLSARDESRLMEYARRLLRFLKDDAAGAGALNLHDLAYTFQIGREAMEERLGVIVSSLSELIARLTDYVGGNENADGLHLGHIKKNRDALAIFEADEEFQEAVDKWVARKKFSKLLELWVKGLSLDWNKLYPGGRPRRISAVTYPFSRERYWVEAPQAGVDVMGAGTYKHDQRSNMSVLLHQNTSTISEQSYRSVFNGDELFVNYSTLYKRALLSEVTTLELVRQAVADATECRGANVALTLANVIWSGPVLFDRDLVELRVSLLPQQGGEIAFEVYSTQGMVKGEPVVYCQGVALAAAGGDARTVDLDEIRSSLKKAGDIAPALDDSPHGLRGGESLHSKSIEEVFVGDHAFLAHLSLPDALMGTVAQYDLNPAFLDVSLQLLQAYGFGAGGSTELRPTALLKLETAGVSLGAVWVYGRVTNPQEPGLGAQGQSAEILWCDEQGRVCASFTGLACQPPLNGSDAGKAATPGKTVFLTKQWREQPIESVAGAGDVRGLGKIAVLATTETREFAYKLADDIQLETELVLLDESDQPPVKSDEEWAKYSGCIDITGVGQISSDDQNWVEWVRCLVEKGQKDNLVLLGVTQGLEAFMQSRMSLGGAERVGLYRMLQSEYARVQSRHVDLAPGQDPEQAVLQITAELFANVDEPEVCYRNGVRYRSVLDEVSGERIASRADFSTGSDGKEKVLLITGGTRGLGYLCATHFVKNHGVKRLLLTGREALPPVSEWSSYRDDSPMGKKVNNMLALMDMGVEVRVVATGKGDDTPCVLEGVAEELGPIHGVIHCAGVMDLKNPAFIRKQVDSIEQVLRPKVSGLNALLAQLQRQPLQFFVLFSSVSSVIPSLSTGQSDYAMANAYMDYVAQTHQTGAPLISIQWPSWSDTGMAADEIISGAYQRSGLRTLADGEGLALLDAILSMDIGPVVLPAIVDEGWHPDLLNDNATDRPQTPARVNVEKQGQDLASIPMMASVHGWLLELLSDELKIERCKLESDVDFADYGVDSVLLAQVSRKINERLTIPLDPSVLFQYSTAESLAGYLLGNHRADFSPVGDVEAGNSVAPAVVKSLTSLTRSVSPRFTGVSAHCDVVESDIVVVGMSCRFPGADDLQAYWELLSSGCSAVRKIPDERFGYPSSVHAGLLESISRFDNDFFLIAKEDAEAMDPQALLVLEQALGLFYHAGYSLGEVKGSSTGVYLGARSQVDLQGMVKARNPIMAVGQNYLATNISQFFDLRGPSMVVDTACSSALVGMSLGIRDLLSGEVNAALVGGVSLMSNDYALNVFKERNLLSKDSEFHIFDQRASGLILGEGAGLVLLKSEEQARKDGDHIYAVVKSVAINNDGRTAGPATPNIEAQKKVMRHALSKSGKGVNDISHIEVNGSGSEVTDLLEIKAIESVYGAARKNSISLGSIKPNIGHPLCAEGIAGFIKLVLMQQHQSWTPFLSANKPMNHYDFGESAFRFVRESNAWSGAHTLALNCFADGGTNAHVILDSWHADSEYKGSRAPLPPPVLNKMELRPAAGGAPESEENIEIKASSKIRSRWKKMEESQA